ncbi:MAG: hypothetical protein QOI20_2110 [Acidimicrobiaceae bacterium]|jgi:hypothetical protein|nr:hypothetical protein [Acidimicrobiaceae bacterium]
MEELEPGTYDGVVVDAEELDDDALSLEIALTSGPHKGAVVRVRGPRAGRDAVSVLGLPVTIDVRDDGIRVAF